MNPASRLYRHPMTGELVPLEPYPSPVPMPTPAPEPPTEYYARDPLSGQLYRIAPNMSGPPEQRIVPNPIPAVRGMTVYDRPPQPDEAAQATSMRIPNGLPGTMNYGRMPDGNSVVTPPRPGDAEIALRAVAAMLSQGLMPPGSNYPGPNYIDQYTPEELRQMYPPVPTATPRPVTTQERLHEAITSGNFRMGADGKPVYFVLDKDGQRKQFLQGLGAGGFLFNNEPEPQPTATPATERVLEGYYPPALNLGPTPEFLKTVPHTPPRRR